MKKSKQIIIALFLTFSCSLYSNEMRNFLSNVIDRSNSVKASQEDLKAGKSELFRSISSFIPTVSLMQSYSNMDENSASKFDFSKLIPNMQIEPLNYKESYRTYFALQSNISAMQFANISLSSRKKKIYEHSLDITKATAFINAFDLYFKLIEYKKNSEFLEEQKILYKKLVKRDSVLLQTNAITQNDILNSLLNLNNNEISIFNIKKDIQSTELEIKNIYGEIPVIEYDSSLIYEIILFDIDTSYESIETNVKNSYTIKLENENYEIAKSSYRASFWNYTPSLNTSFSIGHKENETFDPFDSDVNWNIRLTFTWPLVNFSNAALIGTAKHQYIASKIRFSEKLKKQIKDVYSLSKNIENLKMQLNLLNKNYNLAKSNYDIAKQKYDLGALDEITLLQIKQTLDNITISRLKTEHAICISILNYSLQYSNFEKLMEIIVKGE